MLFFYKKVEKTNKICYIDTGKELFYARNGWSNDSQS